MASNDFTLTTEVDPGADIVVDSATQISFTTLPANVHAYCYWDDGAGKWSGDFIHETEIHPTGDTGISGLVLPWALANAIKAWGEFIVSDNRVGGRYHQNSTNGQFYLIEIYGSSGYSDFTGNITRNIPYYLTYQRAGSVLTCKIYTNAAKTVLIDTLSLTLQSVVAYRYRYPISSNNNGTTPDITGTMQNFNANDVANVPKLMMMGVG